jgi:hypothetical protein
MPICGLEWIFCTALCDDSPEAFSTTLISEERSSGMTITPFGDSPWSLTWSYFALLEKVFIFLVEPCLGIARVLRTARLLSIATEFPRAR